MPSSVFLTWFGACSNMAAVTFWIELNDPISVRFWFSLWFSSCFSIHPNSLVSAVLYMLSLIYVCGFFLLAQSVLLLDKASQDALMVIGFCTRGKGHRVEFVCVCVRVNQLREKICVRSAVSLIMCVMSLCWFWPAFSLFAVNHCVFRKCWGWVRHEGRGFVRGVLKSDPRHINFIILKEIYVILPFFYLS